MALFSGNGAGHKRLKAPGELSRFYIMHPALLLLYYISAISYAIMFTNPIFVLTVCILMFFMAVYYGGLKKATDTTKIAVGIGILIFIINPLINHRGNHIILYLFENPITLEATLNGLFNMIMMFSMLLLFVSFNVLLNSQRFLYLFSRILPQAAFIINMALRYVSLLTIRAKELMGVLSLRGIKIKTDKKADIIKNATKIFTALSEWSLEDGMCIAQTLKAKGFANQKRTAYQRFMFTLRDKLCLIFICISFLLSVALNMGGAGKYSFYTGLEAIKFNYNDFIVYFLMIFTLAMPFIVEGICRIVYKIKVKRTVIRFGIAQKPY